MRGGCAYTIVAILVKPGILLIWPSWEQKRSLRLAAMIHAHAAVAKNIKNVVEDKPELTIPGTTTVELTSLRSLELRHGTAACSMPVLRMVRADSQLIRAAAHFHVIC